VQISTLLKKDIFISLKYMYYYTASLTDYDKRNTAIPQSLFPEEQQELLDRMHEPGQTGDFYRLDFKNAIGLNDHRIFEHFQDMVDFALTNPRHGNMGRMAAAAEFGGFNGLGIYSNPNVNVRKAAVNKNGSDPGCFIAGTLVQTTRGLIPIEQVVIGDSVYTYNEETGGIELKAVADAYVRANITKLVHLEIGEESIFATVEHPFHVKKEWVEAKDLKVGDKVSTLKKAKRVTTVEVVDTLVTVYNLKVEENHNYYITTTGVLVHNNNNCPPISKNAKLLRNGGNDTSVNVKTKAEADALLKEAFPNYQKVKGVGPQDAVGLRRKAKMLRFKQGGAYHKDYAIDPISGRVRGHGTNNAHGQYPHINIKKTDGTKVIINITGE